MIPKIFSLRKSEAKESLQKHFQEKIVDVGLYPVATRDPATFRPETVEVVSMVEFESGEYISGNPHTSNHNKWSQVVEACNAEKIPVWGG